MKCLLLLLMSLLSFSANAATMAFEQPPSISGGVHKSSWYAPNGLDGDEYAFDNFTLSANTAISEIHWRGGYTNYLSGAGKAPVYAFTVSIYRSIGGNSQPDLGTGGRLARYNINSNANEATAGTFGGVIMYDYSFTLSTPFQAAAGTTYWIQIEASQSVTPTYGWPPDWGLCTGTGGNNSYFRRITGGPSQNIAGDLAFSLYTSDAATVTISASPAPTNAGTITGAGVYPINSTVSLTAVPNTGWGFVNWTQSGSQVSTNAHYTFTATVNRTLLANFVPAYTISTSASPTVGGTTSGDGIYNAGSLVTVIATPSIGYVFSNWTAFGSQVSTLATYSFPADSDHALVANFEPDPLAATFTFDDARVHAPFPIDLTANGVSAHFSATGDGYSIQPWGTVGLAPVGMSGLYVFPSSVFPADLIADFSQTIKYFSIMFAPQELACDDTATMRVRAYLNGVEVGTATATAPTPGTYPTGTLSISVPGGFNRAVVHYDSRPPTCGDWGPIFLADNVTVIRACGGNDILQNPLDSTVCSWEQANFSVAVTGSGPFTYHWHHDGVQISNGVGGGGGTGIIAGATTATLTISPPIGGALTAPDSGFYTCTITAGGACELTSLAAMLTVIEPPVVTTDPVSTTTCPNGYISFWVDAAGTLPFDYQWRHNGQPIDPLLNPTALSPFFSIDFATSSDEGSYDCILTNACGATATSAANLNVCIGDYNCDGGVDGSDVAAFFVDWEAGSAAADVNADGGIDGSDVATFFVRWEGGC